MNNIYKVFAAACLLSGSLLCSCDLDEYNPSGENAEQVFVTKTGMDGLVNNLYYNFRWKYYGREDPVEYMETSGDIWQNRATGYSYGNHNTRYINLQGSQCGQTNNAWKRVYDNVNIANNILHYLPENIELSESVKLDYEGEARGMRAYCYWWLVEFFGDVELRTEPTEGACFEAHRTPRTQIYDEVIIPDAERAAEILPVNPQNGNVGRLTKKAAYGLLARVCLARAQYEENGSEAQKAFYQKAYDAANYVIKNKETLGIQLYETYDEIWQARNNKTNSEFLWVVSHSSISSLNANPNNPNRLHKYFSPVFNGRLNFASDVDNWGYPKEQGLTSFVAAPTQYFLSLWQDWDARYDALFEEEFPVRNKYTWTQKEIDNYRAPASLLKKAVKSGKTALKFTHKEVTEAEKEAAAANGILLLGLNDYYDYTKPSATGNYPMKDVNDTLKTTTYLATSFPRFRKYRIWDEEWICSLCKYECKGKVAPSFCPNCDEEECFVANGTVLLAAANGDVGFADVPVMRFAEMPLIAAEAQIGLNHKEEAAAIINKWIRNQRVVKSGYSLSDVQVSASDMTIEWILEERARELCGEWLRWFDLKRTKKLVEYVRGHNPSMIGDDCVDEHNYLWPIPNDYLDKLTNAEEFGQNPGYNKYIRN